RAEVEQVSVGIVALDFEYFRDEPSSRAPLDLHDHLQRISNVALDGAVRQLNAALQDTTCKARETLPRGTGVDCGESPGMSRVQKLQKIKCFAGPDFAQKNSVWTMAESRLEEITNRHRGNAVLFAACLETDEILMVQL